MRVVTGLFRGRTEVLRGEEPEPVPAPLWLVGGATLLWATSYLVRLVV